MADSRSFAPSTELPDSAQALLEAARQVRGHAYCPHSHFAVGAAIRTANGTLFSGANVENDSYGATICAERAAICAMVSAGERQIEALAVVTSTGGSPCGICLQVIREFADAQLPIYLENADTGNVQGLRLGDLLPRPFALD